MIKAILLATSAALALAACSGSSPDAAAPQEAEPSQAAPTPSAGESAPTTSMSASTSATPSSPDAAPPPPPEAPLPPTAPLSAQDQKGDKGARAVLQTWARALEAHEFGLAWEQFATPPASRTAYAKWWERYRTIHVTLGPGESDAAMGSLYYTAPAMLTGKTMAGDDFALQGNVVVRRVNDVDGASPAQLRWHIGSADLKDVGLR